MAFTYLGDLPVIFSSLITAIYKEYLISRIHIWSCFHNCGQFPLRNESKSIIIHPHHILASRSLSSYFTDIYRYLRSLKSSLNSRPISTKVENTFICLTRFKRIYWPFYFNDLTYYCIVVTFSKNKSFRSIASQVNWPAF